MKRPRFTTPSLPGWSPIQVQTEVDVPNFSKRATELALIATSQGFAYNTKDLIDWT